jgi:hypothetical protein
MSSETTVAIARPSSEFIYLEDSAALALNSATNSLEGDFARNGQFFDSTENLHYASIPLPREHVEIIYAKSMIARRLAHYLPEDAFTLLQGWEDDSEEHSELETYLFRIWEKEVRDKCIEAAVMGRMYHDGYLVMWFDDGPPDTPFNPRKGTKLLGAHAKSAWNVNSESGYEGRGEYFDVYFSEEDEQAGVIGSVRFHKSRIIHIPGVRVVDEMLIRRSGRNLSILNYAAEPIAEWVCSQKSAIKLLQSHSLFKYGLKGLAWKTQANDTQGLANRFRAIFAGISKVGGLLYDPDLEEADFVSRTYTGVDKIIAQIDNYLVSNADLPKGLLMNNSDYWEDGNLGGRGAYAETQRRYIVSHVNPAIEKIFTMLGRANGLTEKQCYMNKGKYLDPLKLNPIEEANKRFKHAQTDTLYLNATTPAYNQETVRTRWSSGSYSDEIKLIGDAPEPMQAGGGNETQMARLAASNERGEYTASNTDKPTAKEGNSNSGKKST